MPMLHSARCLYDAYIESTARPAVLANQDTTLESWHRAVDANKKKVDQGQHRFERISARAMWTASYAGRLSAYASKPLDLALGTGLTSIRPEKPELRSVTTDAGLREHLANCIKSPTDTGLLGLAVAITVAVPTLTGAAIGAVSGACAVTLNHILFDPFELDKNEKKQVVKTLAEAGAVVGFGSACMALWAEMILLEGLRVGLGLAKHIVSVPLMAVGFGLGSAYGTYEAFLTKPSSVSTAPSSNPAASKAATSQLAPASNAHESKDDDAVSAVPSTSRLTTDESIHT